MADNYAENEELINKVQNECVAFFSTFQSQREKIDELNEIADYMYACAQNRTLESAEKGQGMNMDKDTRSNVGSTLFHRIVNQNASQLEAVMLSKPDLWKYDTYSKEAVDETKDGEDRADMLRMLSRWTIKADKFLEKVPKFARMLFKRSNIFMMVRQDRREREVNIVEPVYEVLRDEDGQPYSRVVDQKTRKDTKITKNHPSFEFPPVSSVYLDAFIGDMQQQQCVIIQSLKSKADLKDGVQAEWYSEKKYEELTEKYAWDGQAGADELKDKETQRNNDPSIEIQNDLFLVWDIYLNAPIDDSGNWDEEDGETPYSYHWVTLVGNEIGSAICLRCEPNPEPDGEIPLQPIHLYPDDGDRMYHMTAAEVCRSGYSADCTLLNLALDSQGLANDPPLMIVDGMHSVNDWEYKKGARWHVDSPEAVNLMQTPQLSLQTNEMREYVRQGIMMAMNVDKGFVGQSQGARTSASEATFINRNSMQPHLSQIRYILMQTLPWMARKMQSYWMAYGEPDQVVQITDENKKYRINPTELEGEFDVKVEIIDEYESDMLKQQALQNVMSVVGQSEFFQQGEDAQVDGVALLREWLVSQKIDPSKILTTAYQGDSVRIARSNIETMIHGGEYVPVDPQSNFKIHLRECRKEMAQWKGIEQQAMAEGVRIDLLQQHIAELEQAMQGGGGPQQGIASAPQERQPTQGQQGGQALAETMGGIQ